MPRTSVVSLLMVSVMSMGSAHAQSRTLSEGERKVIADAFGSRLKDPLFGAISLARHASKG
jgi:hypothetical protein